MRAGQRIEQWYVSQWFNTAQPIQQAGLRGRVVLLDREGRVRLNRMSP